MLGSGMNAGLRTGYRCVRLQGWQRGALLVATALTAFTASPAWARESSPAKDVDAAADEIVVTARQRSESLIDVPVSVTAMTAEAIDRYSATDLNQIADKIPAIQVTRASSGNGAIVAIRGIYSSYTDPGLESSVSINIDGIQLTRGYLTQAALFDLQQVEVLKGPQALFFGKNSPAGVISIKSAGPGDRLGGFVRAGYEFRADERYVEGALDVPLGETLGARIAFRASDMGGWLHNTALPLPANPVEPALPLPGATTNKRTPGARTFTGRLTLQWEPTSDFSATAKLLVSDYHDNDSNGFSQIVRCGGRAHPTTFGSPDPYDDCKPDNKRSSGNPSPAVADAFPFTGDGDYFTDNRSILGSLALQYQLGDLTLSSNSGIYDLKLKSFGNFDYSSYGQAPVLNIENNRIYVQELRLASDYDGPVNFMLGAFYDHGSRQYFNILRGGFGFPVPFDPAFGDASVTANGDARVKSKTYSAFGQLMWDITDQLQLSGGVRYTREEKSADIRNLYVNPGVPTAVAVFRPAGSPLIGNFEDSNWSPEVSLTWHPAEGQTLYAAYKTGYKSGGFATNGVLTRANTVAALTFNSETAKGGEIGYKAQWFNRRLTFTSALFSYKFNGLQRSSLNIATTSFQIRNAAAARTKGAEAEISFDASDVLTLRGGASYNKAYYLNFTGAPCFNGQTAAQGCVGGVQDLSGETIALAPRFNGTAGASLAFPVGGDIGLGLTGDLRYVSKYKTQDDLIPGSTQDGYLKVNASIKVHDMDDRWDLSLIGLNLFNKYAILYSSSKPFGVSGDLQGVVERGREVRLQATFRF